MKRIFPSSFRPNVRAFIIAALAVATIMTEIGSEEVTLTTYYPAPSGVYAKMITTGDTYLARDNSAASPAGVVIGANHAPRAILDVDSTTSGFLPPRMTDAQEAAWALTNPPTGSVIYNTSTKQIKFYDGAKVVSTSRAYVGTTGNITGPGTYNAANPCATLSSNYHICSCSEVVALPGPLPAAAAYCVMDAAIKPMGLLTLQRIEIDFASTLTAMGCASSDLDATGVAVAAACVRCIRGGICATVLCTSFAPVHCCQ